MIKRSLLDLILKNQYDNKDGFTIVKKEENKNVCEGNITIPLEFPYVRYDKGIFLLASDYIKAPEWITFQLAPNSNGLTDDHFQFDAKLYMLCGIIHYVSQCHYYSDIKLQGSWWRLNDNHDPIKYQSFDNIQQPTIYMLVYTAKPETMLNI